MNKDIWRRLAVQVETNKTEAGRDLFVEVMDATAEHLMQFESELRREAVSLAAQLDDPEEAYTAPLVRAAAKRMTHEVCEGSALAPATLAWMVNEILLKKARLRKIAGPGIHVLDAQEMEVLELPASNYGSGAAAAGATKKSPGDIDEK
jgi:hypothetical protein